jgi:hypothetical protein
MTEVCPLYSSMLETAHLSIIRIFDLKCHKSQALNDFLQTNSNNTQRVIFEVTRQTYYERKKTMKGVEGTATLNRAPNAKGKGP